MGDNSTLGAEMTENDGAVTVTFDRPEKHNAVSDPMLEALRSASSALAERDDLRVMVIAARGPFFTAGIDLDGGVARSMREPSEYPHMHFRRVYREFHRLLDDFESIEKPIVLAVQGRCLGVGVEIASVCDFRLASSNASFALPEVHLGVLAGSGGTSRITRLVGPHWGKWLAMAGEEVTAERALQMGLVHEVATPEYLQNRVDTFVRNLISIPAETLAAAKIGVDLCADADRLTQRHLERFLNAPLYGSPEFRKRTARFTDQ